MSETDSAMTRTSVVILTSGYRIRGEITLAPAALTHEN